jgi:cell filamentation protein
MFCNVKFVSDQAEINALHPFREGNGRSQREFIRLLALKNGYLLHFDRVSEDEMIIASQKSFLCDYMAMEKLIAKCIEVKGI